MTEKPSWELRHASSSLLLLGTSITPAAGLQDRTHVLAEVLHPQKAKFWESWVCEGKHAPGQQAACSATRPALTLEQSPSQHSGAKGSEVCSPACSG